MNWSNFKKCSLVLLLGAIDVFSWILWWYFSQGKTDIQQWINQDFYQTYLSMLSLATFGFFVFIFLIWSLNKIAFMDKIIPYITIAYFGLIFIYGAYCIGISSPASIAGFVSLITVGLVLFERRVVYLTIVPISIFILISIALTLTGKIAYAPIFSEKLLTMPLYKNEFWVYSMLYFYIPIFFASLVLFEILLSQWRKREKMIEHVSIIDPLTGIFNRRKISENIDMLKQQQSSFAIVLLDLDYFKDINDKYGHDIGDIVLQQVAGILTENIHEEDIVGRFGGEEFIILTRGGQLVKAIDIAERCRKAIEKQVILLDTHRKISITASFGVAASINPFIITKEEIIRQADQALYLAKKNGRNQVRHFLEIKIIPSIESKRVI
ncbi:GGDEF domain-containing protein [Acinetobacter nematophilus]|uniref:diguanylate cyclase n=1 Tax=Acinetobacter nematophilus TaxID=2994642 RepID=A0A9X3IJ38_9GAMM|nr:GGDEF domain-containing protein [Acinetobacter nematophilus]MCX5469570.1 GGDEF domain-containing protein [Acinetobacter nematophilus]